MGVEVATSGGGGASAHALDKGIRFLYRIEPGAAQRSYGILVAKLAGLPQDVLAQAQKKLVDLETSRAKQLSLWN
jgi:DNA mismatch repair ATPase MutS